MVNIGIVGTRRRDTRGDYMLVKDTYNMVKADSQEKDGYTTIISGGCKQGADLFARFIAWEREISYKEYSAEWDKYGRSAGAIRNKRIAEESDYLIACVSEDRKGGTEITINEFIKRKGKDKLIIV